MKRLIIILSFVLVVSLVNVSAVEVTGCRTIYDNSILVGNITADRSPCITIGANDITLDCQGYSITGNGFTQGVYANTKEGFTVKNCRILGFDGALDLQNAGNNLIESNVLSDWVNIGSGSSQNVVRWNSFSGDTVWIGGPSNTFEGNTFTISTETIGLNVHSDSNTIRNNVFIGNAGGLGMAISNTDESLNNKYINNTFSNFWTGIELGGYVGGSQYNEVTNNTFENNFLAVIITRGDLNSITGNYINSSSRSVGSEVLDGWGLYMDSSQNNVMWDNTVKNQNNLLDINYNLYCYQGINNTWDFDITPTCEGDCIKPDCSEVLDNQGGWFNGGTGALLNGMGHGPLAETTGLVPTDGIITAAGWQSINYPDAIDGNTLYHTASPSSQYVYWEVHSLLSRYDVYAWKFDHPWSPQMSTAAKYMIKHKYGLTTKYVDQSTPADQWIYLGRYTFDDSELQGVAVFPSTGGIVAADAVKIISVS